MGRNSFVSSVQGMSYRRYGSRSTSNSAQLAEPQLPRQNRRWQPSDPYGEHSRRSVLMPDDDESSATPIPAMKPTRELGGRRSPNIVGSPPEKGKIDPSQCTLRSPLC